MRGLVTNVQFLTHTLCKSASLSLVLWRHFHFSWKMSPSGELPGSSPPFTSLKPPWICDICGGWPLLAETRNLWTRYMCCDTETALTLASASMNPVKAIMTNCIFYGGSQKRAAAHRCRSFLEKSQSLCTVSFLSSPRAPLSQLPSRSVSRHTVMATVIFWRRNLLTICACYHLRGIWNGYFVGSGDLTQVDGLQRATFYQRPTKENKVKSLSVIPLN